MIRQAKMLIVAATLCLLLHTSFSKNVGIGGTKDSAVNEFKYIGTVDHRSYFAEGHQYLNWTSAQALCANAGLTLASIETLAQASFLNETLPLHFPAQAFWTSGRETHKPEGFVWDINDLKPDTSILEDWLDSIGDKYSNCVYLVTYASRNMYNSVGHCTALRNILCQS